MTRKTAKPLFAAQPEVALLLRGMAVKVRAVANDKLSDDAFFASQVGHVVAIARATNARERDLVFVLQELHRGLAMRLQGRRIVQAHAAALPGKLRGPAKAPKRPRKKKKGAARAKRRR